MAEAFNTEGVSEKGLTTLTYTELLQTMQSGLNEIYAQDGEEINFGSETPDGQATNIFAQMGSDIRELAHQVYNSFNPDNCQGSVQDQRYALNYIERKQGTFTVQNIDVTVNQTVTLNGLDGNYNNVDATAYTVGDNSGQLWYLIDTIEITAGTHSLPFRSQNYGSFSPAIGTITNQNTIVLGVVSVNNSVAPTTLGEEQESDAEFRIRRSRSTVIRGQNNYDAMNAQLLELPGVTDAIVHVNNTANTDSTGTAAYTVWAIIGDGANDDIANVIYQNSNGLPTRGAVTAETRTLAGEVFTVHFDRVIPVPLYIRFDVKITDSNFNLNEEKLAEEIAPNLKFNLNAPAETSYITEVAANALSSFGTGAYVLNVEVSTGGTGTTSVSGSGVTAATVDIYTFQQMLGVNITSGNYVFTYVTDKWTYNGNPVNLANYGISVTGEPANNDTVTVAYTSGSWTDFIASASLQNKFVSDATRIIITQV